MQTLLILRHAKSSWKDDAISDHDRPLNKRGQRDAPRLAEWLGDSDLLPDQVFSSAAVRARTTAETIAAEPRFRGELTLLEELYLAPPETYLQIVRSHGTDGARVMVVGHNPGLQSLVYLLTGHDTAFPTAALAHVQLDLDTWRELGRDSTGELAELWTPR